MTAKRIYQREVGDMDDMPAGARFNDLPPARAVLGILWHMLRRHQIASAPTTSSRSPTTVRAGRNRRAVTAVRCESLGVATLLKFLRLPPSSWRRGTRH